ncbi:MAG TPA: group 1 truncated hemoglobin [Steroidobacteraceae bacterium]|nr:group 1 truncated hemoglobin [Steroidobacteraceae bacterium]
MKRVFVTVLLALPMAVSIGCSRSEDPEPASPAAQSEPSAQAEVAAPQKSLYERLGGEAAIKAVVDEFVANVGADARINHYFANADLDRLKGHLVNQIGQASGGPQQYTGRDMKTAHAGMGIDGPAFDALVEDLVKALDKFAVPEQEKSELLAVLGPMRSAIVEK